MNTTRHPVPRRLDPQRLVPPGLDDAERQRYADDVLDRLTPVMSALGVLFLLVVLGERLAQPGSVLSAVMAVAGWSLWGCFVAEFLTRLLIAPDRRRFFRRNWWQLVFLLIPFLRVLRLVRSIRLLRTGRVLSSAVRSSRSASRVLSNRLGWLGTVSAIVILASAELLYGFGVYASYAETLHAAALAAIVGEPFRSPDPYAKALEVALAVYSVAVFATVAASVGAYFVEERGPGTAKALTDAEPAGDE
ncbi:hypothetical protein QNO07_07235 [Streptomyces sp. 549]|uniref:hypothetical protein n=1 Tax=Streptomyces sp. 549 TaxID=3049076 RepID=UPI0024C27696|nr:hypothetical protein [Streptomyces sp. 549]MDK1473217.1 hypothetical protein [Streptomyces sp. 549]